MSILVVVAGLVASASGVLDGRLGSSVRPRAQAVLTTGAFALAALYNVIGLALLAAPVLLQPVAGGSVAQLCQDVLQRFEPGGYVTAWAAAALLGSVLTGAVRRTLRSRRRRAILRIPPSVGVHQPCGEFELVLLPTTDVGVAYSVAGHDPQVVVASGLRARLSEEEFAALVAHEFAHIRRHHQRWLNAIDFCSGLLWFVPWARRSARAARVALESWADDDAAAIVGRRPLRSALLAAVDVAPVFEGVASFNGADAIARRVAILDGEQATPLRFGSTVALGALAAMTVIAGIAGGGPQLTALLSHICPL